jgi:hypothetical protein
MKTVEVKLFIRMDDDAKMPNWILDSVRDGLYENESLLDYEINEASLDDEDDEEVQFLKDQKNGLYPGLDDIAN